MSALSQVGPASTTTGRAALGGCPDAVFDALVHGLGEAVELADVEIDPALVIVRLLRNQHHLALDDAGVADDERPGSTTISGRSLPKCRVIPAITAWA